MGNGSDFFGTAGSIAPVADTDLIVFLNEQNLLG